jgi:alkylhydroperoxidase AhpD family core domain
VTDETPDEIDTVTDYDPASLPSGFTMDGLGWVPWLTPMMLDEFEQRHWDGVVDPARARQPYFALLAREPEILAARTRADFDIFLNEDGGLPREERELAATVASRVNGCVFCASVHSRAAAKLSGRDTDIQSLLVDGPSARSDERWDAVVDLAAALTVTPIALEVAHIDHLRAVGLDDVDIADAIASAAFFSWANRLMLSLGEPEVPARRRAG